MGEAKKEHKRQFVYSPLEVDCEFLWLTNLDKSNGHAQSPLHQASQIYATHRLGATTRSVTRQYIQLSDACCSLRTYWLKWSQRHLKTPLETSGPEGCSKSAFQDLMCISDSIKPCRILPSILLSLLWDGYVHVAPATVTGGESQMYSAGAVEQSGGSK